ncbi:hypothetical protein [Streptomyces syringium]|uniref:hypothetical protein n=1 Tax=Streptomyces syringium TaxID=76729 RepID=UPI0033DE35CE
MIWPVLSHRFRLLAQKASALMESATAPRYVRLDALLLAALIVGAYALGAATTVYDGENAGVVIGTKSCAIGLEWRGSPGVFGNCFGHSPDAEIVNAYNDGWLDAEASAAAP